MTDVLTLGASATDNLSDLLDLLDLQPGSTVR